MSRAVATLLAGVVVLTWIVCFELAGKPLNRTYLGPFSVAVSALVTSSLVYNHWLWHWPLVHLLKKTPYLTGTWEGVLRSDYLPTPDSKPLPPIEAFLAITQTAEQIHVRLFTKESDSTTVAASVEAEPGYRFSLASVYRNEPGLDLQHRSPIHYGATRLNIEGEPRQPKRLAGSYWTARKPTMTSGTMEFTFKSRKVCHSFEEGKALARKRP